MDLNKPNLFIVGAPKCGTTSIYHYLNQSPVIFMSRDKEPHYLAFNESNILKSIFGDKNSYKTLRSNPYPVTDKEKYHKLFETNNGYKYLGEASTLYLYSKYAARNIYENYYQQSLRIIILLRNPVERAYSQFLHHVREDLEYTNDFLQAFKNEQKRLERGPFWHYRKVGLYAEQVKRYYELFDKDKVKVLKFEDFIKDSSSTKKEICAFLGLEPIEETNNFEQRYNATGYPVNKFVQKTLIRISSIPFKDKVMKYTPENLINLLRSIRQNNLYKPELNDSEKKELMKYFHQDIKKLKKITGMDFPEWEY